MANYLATDTDLTAVANAIRQKGGTSASLAFPADFVTAIGAISGGGGSGPEWNEVTVATAATNLTDCIDAIIPSRENGKSYCFVLVNKAQSAFVTDQLVEGIFLEKNKCVWYRYRGSAYQSNAGFGSNYDAAIVVGDKFLVSEVRSD